jgi:hypothetical protein
MEVTMTGMNDEQRQVRLHHLILPLFISVLVFPLALLYTYPLHYTTFEETVELRRAMGDLASLLFGVGMWWLDVPPQLSLTGAVIAAMFMAVVWGLIVLLFRHSTQAVRVLLLILLGLSFIGGLGRLFADNITLEPMFQTTCPDETIIFRQYGEETTKYYIFKIHEGEQQDFKVLRETSDDPLDPCQLVDPSQMSGHLHPKNFSSVLPFLS